MWFGITERHGTSCLHTAIAPCASHITGWSHRQKISAWGREKRATSAGCGRDHGRDPRFAVTLRGVGAALGLSDPTPFQHVRGAETKNDPLRVAAVLLPNPLHACGHSRWQTPDHTSRCLCVCWLLRSLFSPALYSYVHMYSSMSRLSRVNGGYMHGYRTRRAYELYKVSAGPGCARGDVWRTNTICGRDFGKTALWTRLRGTVPQRHELHAPRCACTGGEVWPHDAAPSAAAMARSKMVLPRLKMQPRKNCGLVRSEATSSPIVLAGGGGRLFGIAVGTPFLSAISRTPVKGSSSSDSSGVDAARRRASSAAKLADKSPPSSLMRAGRILDGKNLMFREAPVDHAAIGKRRRGSIAQICRPLPVSCVHTPGTVYSNSQTINFHFARAQHPNLWSSPH